MTKSPPPPFSFRLELDLKAELEKLAEKDDRSLSNYLHKVLRDHVAASKKKR